MSWSLRYSLIPALGLDEELVPWNPNRVKVILSTNYNYFIGQGHIRIYRPPYATIGANGPWFPLWGGYSAANSGAGPPPYLLLEGVMAHGPYGAMNPNGANAHTVYILEEISDLPPSEEESTEALGIDVSEEEPELKLRKWGPFVW